MQATLIVHHALFRIRIHSGGADMVTSYRNRSTRSRFDIAIKKLDFIDAAVGNGLCQDGVAGNDRANILLRKPPADNEFLHPKCIARL